MLLCFSPISAQEYNDVWLRDWVNNQGISNTLAGRNLSITVADHVYEAVHQLNDDGQHDLVLSKSTLKGVQVWIDTFNLSATTANILLGDMILDGNDDILITGAVYNGSNNYDALTLKYTSAGSLSWYELYDGSASFYDGGVRIAVDANDNVFVTGGTSSSTSNVDLLILAYQSNGTLSWSIAYDGYGAFDAGSYVAAISTSTLHVVALSESTVSEKWHVLDRKYNSTNGNLIVGASSDEVTLAEVGDVTLDDNDNIYITGWKPTTGQGRDIVVVKLDDGAAIQWEKTFNGTADADDQTNAITAAANGDVIVGGFKTTANGDHDGLLLKYNSSGTLQWQQTVSGAANGNDEITDVLIAGSGEIYLCGQIHEAADEDYLFQRRSASTGNLLHELTFAGWVGGDDRAEILLEDADGGIIISGKTAAGASGQFPTAVRYAVKSYFLPPNSEPFNSALPYVHQHEQLITLEEGKPSESIKYYSGNHFLQNDSLSIIQAIIDTISTTPDSINKVSISFGDNKNQRVFALDKRNTYYNYYMGHIQEGRINVPLSDEVMRTDAWPGIDVLHGSNGSGITYGIIIEPGINPGLITMTFAGHNTLSVNNDGELEIATALGTITWPAPTITGYDAVGNSYPISGSIAYSIVGNNQVEFSGVNSSTNLYQVIDIRKSPTTSTGGGTNLEWCTYFAGDAQTLLTSIDSKPRLLGPDLYQTGHTYSSIFPIVNAFQEFSSHSGVSFYEVYISKFDGELNLSWSTFLGGDRDDKAYDLLVRGGDVIVVGSTTGIQVDGEDNPSNFPLRNNGASYFDGVNNGLVNLDFCGDGFIAVFLEDGTLNHSTFFGRDGFLTDEIFGIAENESTGDIYMVGEGFDAPLLDDGSSNLYQNFGLSFFSRFDTDLKLLFSTKFNAQEIDDVQVAPNGNIIIGGLARPIDNVPVVAENSESYSEVANGEPMSGDVDIFVTKISPFPHSILWSTHFGGVLDERWGELSVGDSDDIYLVGRTDLPTPSASGDFPLFDPGDLLPGNIFDDDPDGLVQVGESVIYRESFFAHFNSTGKQEFTTFLGEGSTGGSRLSACEAFTTFGTENIVIGEDQ